METFGWVATLAVGISLGLLGGGGSILTVPVLVYLFGLQATVATGYSLFIVGITAFIGSVGYITQRLFSLTAALAFAIPSMLTVFVTRSVVVPSIPDRVLGLGKHQFILLLFAALMLAAGSRMAWGKEPAASDRPKLIPLIIVGALVGFAAGVVGAGGGFLIVPALVLFGALPIRTAVGTSLLIIAVQSLVGFVGDVSAGAAIEWEFLASITLVASIGIIFGMLLSKRVRADQLRSGFGWFVLGMAILMVATELARS